MSKSKFKYAIYTDGAAAGIRKGNPNSSWAFTIIDEKADISLYSASGLIKGGTNQQAELKAIVEAIVYYKENFRDDPRVRIFSDSKYAINSLSSWAYVWEKCNWTTMEGNPVKNLDLVKEGFYNLMEIHVDWRWIKGHSGIKYNEMVDDIAKQELQKYLQIIENV